MTSPGADPLRQWRSGGTVVLPQRLGRTVWGVLGSLAFVAFGLFMITLGIRELLTEPSAGVVVACFILGVLPAGVFGYAAVGLLRTVVHPRRLVLTAHGFAEEERLKGQWYPVGTGLRWDEVIAFSIDHIKPPKLLIGRGIPVLTYHLTDAALARLRSEVRANRPDKEPRVRRPRMVMRTAFGPAKELLPLFATAHQEFGGPHQRVGG